MKLFIRSVAALIAIGTLVHARTSELYLNRGLVADEINIDARVVDNRGVMLLSPMTTAFDTQGTEVYRNSGLIVAEPGIRFGYIGADGTRRASQSFSNAPNARIESIDTSVSTDEAWELFRQGVPFGLMTPDELDALFLDTRNAYRNGPDSYLSIWADSIVNRGAIFGAAGGEFWMKGRDVDLSRSILGINPPSDVIAEPPEDGEFRPIPASTDVHWAYGDGRFDSRRSVTFDSVDEDVDGEVVTRTNVTINLRYRVGTPSNPIGVDNSTDAATAGVLENFELPDPNGRPLVLNEDVIPFVWNSANPDAASASLTNPSTNQVFTIVLVRRASTNLIVDASFLPPQRGAEWSHPTVRLRLTGVGTNNITGRDDAVSYVIDNTFGSDPFRLYVTNFNTGIPSRPTNLVISRRTTRNVSSPFTEANRATPTTFSNAVVNLLTELELLATPQYNINNFAGADGEAPNATHLFRPDLLTTWVGPGATNLPFTNLVNTSTPYMAHRVEFGIVPGSLPVPLSVPGISPTNGVGRLHIEAENLNLELARIRGQGPVILKSPNVISTRLASIDAPYVQADLGSRSGTLNLNGLFQASVQRLSGAVQIYSATFTNLAEVEVPAPTPEDPDEEPGEPSIVGLEAIFHVMIVDADLTPSFPTPFLDLSLRSTNVNIGDNLQVSRFAMIEAENLTVNGRLIVQGDYGDFGDTGLDASNLPILKNLTNNGIIAVSNSVVLGGDRPTPWASFINNGLFRAATIAIRADDVVFGPVSSVRAEAGDFLIDAQRLTIRSGASFLFDRIDVPLNPESANVFLPGTVRAYSQFSAVARDVILGGGAVLSAPTFELTANRQLSVEPEGAGIVGAYGISVTVPPSGLETRNLRVSLVGQTFQESVFVWPGEDVGPTAAGFGRQSVASLELEAGRFSQLTFRGAVGRGALYVENLILSPRIASLVDGLLVVPDPTMFNVASDFTIYFRNLQSSDGEGLPPAQFEAATGGKFKFVGDGGDDRDFITLLINGRPTTVARSIRFSIRTDTDGDGIINAFDGTPFEGVVQSPKVVQDGQHAFLIRWEGAAFGTYDVQYSDALSTEWKLLKRVTNTEGSKKTLWVRDPIPETDGGRSYRILTK
jgi:hypothetical protein